MLDAPAKRFKNGSDGGPIPGSHAPVKKIHDAGLGPIPENWLWDFDVRGIYGASKRPRSAQIRRPEAMPALQRKRADNQVRLAGDGASAS